MKVADLKPLDFIRGLENSYIVIGTSSRFTFEAVNIETLEEETIEGDYIDNGDLTQYDFDNKGNVEIYILKSKLTDIFKEKLEKITSEIKEFYLN